MKKDLSVIALEMFPDIKGSEYETLLHNYLTPSNITPKLTLDEAVNKYTDVVLSVIDNKENWKENRIAEEVYITFYEFYKVFEEFFPMEYAENGYPYVDIAKKSISNGKKIIEVLIPKIFYRNYESMEIRAIYFWRDEPLSPEYIRIYLRFSDMEAK